MVLIFVVILHPRCCPTLLFYLELLDASQWGVGIVEKEVDEEVAKSLGVFSER